MSGFGWHTHARACGLAVVGLWHTCGAQTVVNCSVSRGRVVLSCDLSLYHGVFIGMHMTWPCHCLKVDLWGTSCSSPWDGECGVYFLPLLYSCFADDWVRVCVTVCVCVCKCALIVKDCPTEVGRLGKKPFLCQAQRRPSCLHF